MNSCRRRRSVFSSRFPVSARAFLKVILHGEPPHHALEFVQACFVSVGMTTTSKSAILILPLLAPPLGDRVFGDLIFASDLRLGFASLDFANHFEFEFAGECASLNHCGPRRYCALLRHR